MSDGIGNDSDDPVDYGSPKACYQLKLEHDACFYQWYWNEFLEEKAKPEQPCQASWQRYRSCLEKKVDKLGVGYLMQSRVEDDAELRAKRKPYPVRGEAL